MLNSIKSLAYIESIEKRVIDGERSISLTELQHLRLLMIADIFNQMAVMQPSDILIPDPPRTNRRKK